MNLSKLFAGIISIVVIFQLFACVNQPPLLINKSAFSNTEINENIKNIVLKFDISDGDTIVDIGCGDGTMDFEIFKLNPNTYFILEDIKKKKIYTDFIYSNNKVKKYFENSYTFVTGMLDSIPLSSNRYKKILCTCVLHELSNTTAMMNEINRIMTKDAILIITEPISYKKPDDKLSCGKNFLNKEQIIQIVSSNNFELIRSDTTNNSRDSRISREYNILAFVKKG